MNLTDIINRAIARIWADVTADDVGYGQASVPLPTVPNVESVPLPADHMSTVALFRPDGASLRRATRRTELWYLDRYPDDITGQALSRPGIYWYTPSTLVLRPIPTIVEELRLLYDRSAPVLVNPADSLDTIADWDNIIIDFSVGECHQDMQRRSYFTGRAEAALAQRLQVWGARRDQGPDRIENYLPSARAFGDGY